VHANNTAPDPARFGIPSDVIADFECCRHGVIVVAPKSVPCRNRISRPHAFQELHGFGSLRLSGPGDEFPSGKRFCGFPIQFCKPRKQSRLRLSEARPPDRDGRRFELGSWLTGSCAYHVCWLADADP
jgi:hypothetical protein